MTNTSTSPFVDSNFSPSWLLSAACRFGAGSLALAMFVALPGGSGKAMPPAGMNVSLKS